MRIEKVWGRIDLPEWDLIAFHATFLRIHQKQERRGDRELLARYLMVLVAQKVLGDKHYHILKMNQIEVEEAASMVMNGPGPGAKGLFRKVIEWKIRHPDQPKVLIAMVNQAIDNDLVSVWRKKNRKTAINAANDEIGLDRADDRSMPVEVDGLTRYLGEVADEVCGQDAVLRQAWRIMSKTLVSGMHVPTHEQMLIEMGDTITADAYLGLTTQLNQRVRRYARDLSACGL